MQKKFYHTRKNFPKKSQDRFVKKDIYKCPIFRNPFKEFWEKIEKSICDENAINPKKIVQKSLP
jgi:hypothetical protein